MIHSITYIAVVVYGEIGKEVKALKGKLYLQHTQKKEKA